MTYVFFNILSFYHSMCSCQMFFKDCRVTLDNDRKLMSRMTNLSFQASGSTRGSYTGIYVQNRLSYNRDLSLSRAAKLGTPMSILFARAESFGICFFIFVCWNCTFAKTQENVRFENEVCPQVKRIIKNIYRKVGERE